MRRSLRRAAAVAALGFLASAGLVVGAGTASALPSECQVERPVQYTGRAICHSGTGQVRVKVTCKDNFSGSTSVQYGPWVGIERYSSVSCYPAQRSVAQIVDYQRR